jgi:hypothetical protein
VILTREKMILPTAILIREGKIRHILTRIKDSNDAYSVKEGQMCHFVILTQ